MSEHYHDVADVKFLKEMRNLAPAEFNAWLGLEKIVGREDGTIPRKYRSTVLRTVRPRLPFISILLYLRHWLTLSGRLVSGPHTDDHWRIHVAPRANGRLIRTAKISETTMTQLNNARFAWFNGKL